MSHGRKISTGENFPESPWNHAGRGYRVRFLAHPVWRGGSTDETVFVGVFWELSRPLTCLLIFLSILTQPASF